MTSGLIKFGKIEGDWSDRPLFIIGGGPSLEGFDFSVLDGRTLGANKSAWVADCDFLCSLDQTFVRRAHREITEYVASGKGAYLIMPPNERSHEQIPGAAYAVRIRGKGMSCDPERVHGVNSGYGSLNLGYLMGATSIGLLGFDMNTPGHFHDGYEWSAPSQAERFYPQWAQQFDPVLPQLNEAGIEVTNYVGPNGSGIKAFPTKPLETLC